METIYPGQVDILVVDDTRDNLRLLSNILVAEGFHVRPVSTGKRALSAAMAQLPDLILLDILMPDLDGYEVCAQLKIDARLRDVPVIFISALDEPLDKLKAFTAGGVDFITKPFQEAEVLARVKAHLAVFTMHRQLMRQNTQLASEIAERQRTEQELRKLSRAVEQSANAVMITNAQGLIEFVNPAFSRTTGYTPDEAIGQFPNILKSGRHPVEIYRDLWETIQRGKIWKGELCNQKKSGQLYWESITISPIKDASGAITHYVSVQEDITDRKQAELALQQYTHELGVLNDLGTLLQMCDSEPDTYEVFSTICAQLFPSDSGVLFLLDEAHAVLQAAASWGGFPWPLPPVEASGENLNVQRGLVFEELVGPEACGCPYVAHAPETVCGCFCLPLVIKEGTIGGVSVFVSPPESDALPDDGPHVVEQRRQTMRQVIEHYALALANIRLRERLRQESIHDPLTGLYNRRYMEESLRREIHRALRQNTATAVLMLDVDHFKSFNDSYGHAAGDIVLQSLGALLQRHIRGGDIACRYGGEEFLLILPDAALPIAVQRGNEILRQIRRLRLTHQDSSVQITASIGVAVLPDHAGQVETLIRAADEALYAAKANGRDQVMIASPQPAEDAGDPLPEVCE